MFGRRKIVYINNHNLKDYAKIKDENELKLARKYGASSKITSLEFEKLQEKASKDGVQVYWIES